MLKIDWVEVFVVLASALSCTKNLVLIAKCLDFISFHVNFFENYKKNPNSLGIAVSEL